MKQGLVKQGMYREQENSQLECLTIQQCTLDKKETQMGKEENFMLKYFLSGLKI